MIFPDKIYHGFQDDVPEEPELPWHGIPADDNLCRITAFLYHPDPTQPEGLRLATEVSEEVVWEIIPHPNNDQAPEVEAELLDTQDEPQDKAFIEGVAGVTFQASSTAEDRFMVLARVPRLGLQVETGVLKVVPGMVDHVEMSSSLGIIPADATRKFHVYAVAYDIYDNTLPDGTPVIWSDAGLTSLVEDEFESTLRDHPDYNPTATGITRAAYQAGPLVESTTDGHCAMIEIQGSKFYLDLDFRPIEVTLQRQGANDPLDIHVGGSATFRARFQYQGGAPLPDGTPILWETSNGTLANAASSISGGEGYAYATLTTENGRVGKAVLSVSLAPGTQGNYATLDFISSARSYPVLKPGYMTYGEMDCDVTIHGPPGALVRLDPVVLDLLIAEFKLDDFQDIRGYNRAADATSFANHGIIQGGVTLDTAHKKDGAASYQFNGTDGLIGIPDAQHLHLAGRITLKAWIYPDSSQEEGQKWVVLSRPGEYEIALEKTDGERKLRFTVWTYSEQTGSVATSCLSNPLAAANNEYEIEATFDALQQVRMKVNGDVYSAPNPAPANIRPANMAIGIGAQVQEMWGCLFFQGANFFKGSIDEVSIRYDRGTLLIAGVDANGEVTLDANGEAELTFQPSEPLPTGKLQEFYIISVRVIITMPGGQPPEEDDLIMKMYVHDPERERKWNEMMARTQLQIEEGVQSVLCTVLPIDSAGRLIKLALTGEGDFKQATLDFLNVALVFEGPLKALGLAVLARNTGKLQLALSKMYRLGAAIGTSYKLYLLKELFAFLQQLGAAYLESLEKGWESEHDLDILNDVYQNSGDSSSLKALLEKSAAAKGQIIKKIMDELGELAKVRGIKHDQQRVTAALYKIPRATLRQLDNPQSIRDMATILSKEVDPEFLARVLKYQEQFAWDMKFFTSAEITVAKLAQVSSKKGFGSILMQRLDKNSTWIMWKGMEFEVETALKLGSKAKEFDRFIKVGKGWSDVDVVAKGKHWYCCKSGLSRLSTSRQIEYFEACRRYPSRCDGVTLVVKSKDDPPIGENLTKWLNSSDNNGFVQLKLLSELPST